MVRLLLELRANANTLDVDGVSLLGQVMNPELVAPLVAAGARVNEAVGAVFQQTPLWYAYDNQLIRVAQELIRFLL